VVGLAAEAVAGTNADHAPTRSANRQRHRVGGGDVVWAEPGRVGQQRGEPAVGQPEAHQRTAGTITSRGNRKPRERPGQAALAQTGSPPFALPMADGSAGPRPAAVTRHDARVSHSRRRLQPWLYRVVG
jgi:hypothetical protein